MNPVLFQIHESLGVQMYGLCIAVGMLITFLLLKKDPVLKGTTSYDTIITILQLALISGYLGGRIVFMLSNTNYESWLFLFQFWLPGLSILGAVIAIASTLMIYSYLKHIPLLKLMDRLSIYGPLTQSFGRIGCFFAGCCYGKPLDACFAIIYDHENHMAPLFCKLHPTQLYSSFILFSIFLLMYYILQYRYKKTGLLFCSYLILTSTERFFVDFFRWDQEFVANIHCLSFHQLIALGIISFASLAFLYISYTKDNNHGSI